MGSAEGFESITLTSADGSTSAEFVPEANLVCCSFIVDGHELLDRRDGVRAYAEHGKTMGVPLLYPWANRLARFGYRAAGKDVMLSDDDSRIPRDTGGLPIHGVLPGLLRWEVEDARAPGALAAGLRWAVRRAARTVPVRPRRPGRGARRAGRAHGHDDRHRGGRRSGPGVVWISPVTRVPGGSRDDWVVTLGAADRLVLDDRSIPTGARAPIDREPFPLAGASLDDAFAAASDRAAFEAATGDAGLTVEFLGGYSYAQVFAPAGHEFTGFEPMTAPATRSTAATA